MRKRFVVLMLLLVVIFSTACGTNETTNSSGVDHEFNLVEQGKLTWASSGLYKPFNYSENGELKGFDVEIGYALAEKLGLEPNPVTTPWETILQGLKGEKFDIILGSMAITDDRLEQVNFTDPYYYSGGTVFVSVDNNEIKTADDLIGKRIGVVAQSTYDEAAQQYTDDIKYYNSDVTALNDLTVKGRLDAVITDSIVGFEAQAAGLTIKEAGDRLWVERIGIAVRKDDEELLEALNEVIEEIVVDGTYVDISNDFFGTNLLDVNLEGVEIYK
ncbi:transporter substrate-binding domain-containing protein [Cytobacillus sp. IB215665]|uniref:transporter substrate-binding domain-containing protein n=1 Tax=Cytobacillus sp. IB215665 TaxID=3097357 RepID=UPI002A0C4204|nr:transporter substrate-binding domain-containing protein [Cytobacillus sp. IB215665]MDX8363599.1 transporter substrate-binding domain-containing protein [Cytobacillus sp. IB215665]